MSIFIYYVFWPFVGSAVTCYLGLMQPGTQWYFLGLWFLPWVTWPVGKYRRLYMLTLIAKFETEAKEEKYPGVLPALALGLGPALLMVLSSLIALTITPTYMEVVMGIDVQAKIEEIADG